jgi:hypothetical protein
MELFNEYLVGSWTISSNITNSLLAASHRARIYLVLANKESELVDHSNSEVAPKKPAYKSIHIHKPTIVAWLESHIM